MQGLNRADFGRALVLFLLNFCVVAMTVAGKSARDTFFLSRFNKAYLPLMLVASAITVVVASSVYGRLSSRISRSTLFNLGSAAFAGGVLLLGLNVSGWVIPVLYVWVEIIISIASMQLWLLASDTFNPRQAKKLFGIIGGGGSLAALVIGSSLKPFVQKYGATPILTVLFVLLVIYWALGQLALRSAHQPAPQRAAKAPTQAPRLDSYLLSIAAVIGLSAIVSQITDYQFKMIASDSFSDERDLAGFFGHFYAITGAASLLVQFFLTSAILSRFGLVAGLATLPASLSVGSLAVLFDPKIWSGALSKFADQTFKFTLANSSLELLWLPVHPDRRRTVRPLISGSIKSACEVGSGLLMFLLIQLFAPRYLSLISVAAIAIWLVVIVRLKKLYVKSLIAAIEKHQLDFEGLSIDAQDPEITAVIDRALKSDDEAIQFSALELLEGLPLAPWETTLTRLLEVGTPEIKARLMDLASDERRILPDAKVISLMADRNGTALSAMRLAGGRQLASAVPELSIILSSQEPATRAAAAAAILNIAQDGTEHAKQCMHALVNSPDPQERAAALSAPTRVPWISAERLRELLSDSSRPVRAGAIAEAARRNDVSLLPSLVANLQDARLAAAVRSALASLPPDDVVEQLSAALTQGTLAPAAVVVRAVGDIDSDRSIQVLIRYLEAAGLEVATPVANSLRRIGTRRQLPPEVHAKSASVAGILIREAYRCNRMLKLLPDTERESLLREHFEHEIHEAVSAVLRLQVMNLPPRTGDEVLVVVHSRDTSRLSYVMELLENLLSREQRELLTGLLEPLPVEARDAIATKHLTSLPANADAELRRLSLSSRPWVSAIVITYLRQTSSSLPTAGEANEAGEQPAFKGEPLAAKAREKMYSTLEKTILLKSVSLFREIPAEKLSQIAQIAEERSAPSGERILREGDPGDSLYIIATGSVRIHKQERVLTYLKKGDCLGEMAVLDHSPRSADATAEEDSILLRIAQEDFYEVLSANPEISEALIRLLTRRLRESNERASRP
jgi:CRP-like cAMP-binding protein/ATP/ADP translocase